MVEWYWLVLAFLVGAGLTWGFRGWVARTKEKVQSKLG